MTSALNDPARLRRVRKACVIAGVWLGLGATAARADWTSLFDSGPGALNHWTDLVVVDTSAVVTCGAGGAPASAGVVVRCYTSAGAVAWTFALPTQAPEQDHARAAALLPGGAVVVVGATYDTTR